MMIRAIPSVRRRVVTRAAVPFTVLSFFSLSPAPMLAQLDRTVPPTLGAPPTVTLPPVTVRELPNGLKLLIVERHQLPLASFTLIVPGGSTLNPASKAGAASFVADMLVEGTKTRSSLEIADEIAFLGADLRARSDWDALTVSLNTPTARLDDALALFADVSLNPAFPEAEFTRLQKTRLTELLQLKDHGPAIASRAYLSVLYGDGHPYGRPARGTEESVGGMAVSDVSSFYKSHFVPNSATMVIVGDVTPEAIERKIAGLFGEWSRGTEASVSADNAPAARPTTIYLIDKPGAEQSSFRIGAVGVPRSTPDFFPLQVANTILGGSFTSRLNFNLRETKGFTYGAFSMFDMRKSAGPFVAQSEIVAAQTDSALVEFMKELNAIRDTVPQDELAKAKQFLALQLPSRFETNSDVAQQLIAVALYGLPLDYYNHYVSSVESVTQADVQRVTSRYIDPSRLSIVIVGDRASVEPKLRALNVAPIEFRDLNGRVVQ